MKSADPHTFRVYLQQRVRTLFAQDFTVQRPGQLAGQDKANLLFIEQLADTFVLRGNDIVFTKGLAPVSEVSRIALDCSFERHTCKHSLNA